MKDMIMYLYMNEFTKINFSKDVKQFINQI